LVIMQPASPTPGTPAAHPPGRWDQVSSSRARCLVRETGTPRAQPLQGVSPSGVSWIWLCSRWLRPTADGAGARWC